MKRHYLLALVCYLLIPVAMVGGFAVAMLMHPESAMLAVAAAAGALWLATCYFVLRAKGRHRAWLVLAVFGPFGFVALGWLRDRAPDDHAGFVDSLALPVRLAYEAVFFLVIWVGAYQAMLLKRELSIRYRSAMTGMSVDDIVREQAASSGMWAFGEGLVVLYLVPLAYLLWPLVFNLIGSWRRKAASSARS